MLTKIKSTLQKTGSFFHKIISAPFRPLLVEFKFKDIMEIVIGACILAVPVSFTEEVWTIAETLPTKNLVFLSLLSLSFIATFIYFNYYKKHFKQHIFQYIKRVFSTYIFSLLVVAVLLTIIQKAPWSTDALLAIKRIIIIGFPASMSATLSDTIK